MIIKYILTITYITISLLSSTKIIDTKIKLNNKILKDKVKEKSFTATKIKQLAILITKKENEYKKINTILDNLDNTIFLNKVKLSNVKKTLKNLNFKTIKNKKDTEAKIIEEITNKYSSSIGISLAKKQTIQELIDKEIYSLLLDESSQNIISLNIKYLKLSNDARKNKEKSLKLIRYIKQQEKQKVKYKKLKLKKQYILEELSKQHQDYQNQLKNILKKQDKLEDLLGSLNILKIKKIKNERLKQKRLKAQELRKKERIQKIKNKEIRIKPKRKLRDEININIRNLGSSTKGVQISTYRGIKTIAPLRSYTIVKKFGKYYDPVYKLELFNEAITMKPNKLNSKVYNVLSGKIVYAKKNSGTLENIVIVQHKSGLHTVYSHLDKIAPTLKINKWIKKGFVVGRVSNILIFQATKNSKFINPEYLFK
jgi:murein DD-endopeptidase MepM/ murein hydrolase activator NlpD